MKNLNLVIILSLLGLFSCEKETNWEKYYLNAQINGEKWSWKTSQPYYKLSNDTTWFFDLVMLDGNDHVRERITIRNFTNLEEYDTIYLKHNLIGEGLNKIPSAFFFIKEDDALLKAYELLENEETSNWVVFNEVKNKSASGIFHLSFKVAESSPSTIPDEHRPDTFTVTNGSFKAFKIE